MRRPRSPWASTAPLCRAGTRSVLAMVDLLNVGALKVPMAEATVWVREYFDADANLRSKAPYAYPAYDGLDTGSGPNELNDGDLLAPALLNVRPTISAFYRLQAARPHMQGALEFTGPDVTLADTVADGTLPERLIRFVGVLDTHDLPGVKLTTLTKVLHRKRPRFMPLHDQFVDACYRGPTDAYPVRRVRKRTWVKYWSEVCTAITRDVEAQPTQWASLREGAPRRVSELRILDVVAWNAGRNPTCYL